MVLLCNLYVARESDFLCIIFLLNKNMIPVQTDSSLHKVSFDEKFPEVAMLMEKRYFEHMFLETLRKQAQRTTLDRVREAMKIHM